MNRPTVFSAPFIENILGNQQIDFATPGLSRKERTWNILSEWRGSETITKMLEAQAYYEVRNLGIREKTRDYRDAEGNVVKQAGLSNVQIVSAFYRDAVIQKVNYAFTQPFILTVEPNKAKKTSTAAEEAQADGEDVDPRLEIYLSEWQDFIDIHFLKMIKRLATEAINKGIGWVYPWIDDEGTLQITAVESETLYPAWHDREHTKLDAVVRDFEVIELTGMSQEKITKVEYWDKDSVDYYIEKGGDLQIDPRESDYEDLPSSAIMRDADGEPMTWGRVPFLFLKSSDDEITLLALVKPYIDAYDLLNSITTDGLIDDINAVLLLSGVSPEMGSLMKTRELIRQSRIASVEATGDAKYLQVKPDISAARQQLEFFRKDVWSFTSTVDPQDVKFGNNPSGVALKSMYQSADIYTNGIETEFRLFIEEQLKHFFDLWLEFRGIGTAAEWSEYKIIVELNRDMMINESALIQDTANLAKTGVSQETMDEYNPAVIDHKTEERRREEDYQKALERQAQQSEIEMMMQQMLHGGGETPQTTGTAGQQPVGQPE